MVGLLMAGTAVGGWATGGGIVGHASLPYNECISFCIYVQKIARYYYGLYAFRRAP